jgi:hypothetical protein
MRLSLRALLSVALLISVHGCDPDAGEIDECSESVLQAAVYDAAIANNGVLLGKLIRYGIDLQRPGGGGATPLILAADAGKLANVAKLLEQEVSTEFMDNGGFTALISASQGGHTGVVKLLLESGANIDVQAIKGGGNGMTALMSAAFYGHTSVLTVLLDHKANVNLGDSNGFTSLDYASDQNQTAAAKMLIDVGAVSGLTVPTLVESFIAEFLAFARNPESAVDNFLNLPVANQAIVIVSALTLLLSVLVVVNRIRTKSKYRAILRAFYKEHNPEMMEKVETILTAYAGHESAMMRRVRAKYLDGKDPENEVVTQSKSTSKSAFKDNFERKVQDQVVKELEQKLQQAKQEEASKKQALHKLQQQLEQASREVDELETQLKRAREGAGKQD